MIYNNPGSTVEGKGCFSKSQERIAGLDTRNQDDLRLKGWEQREYPRDVSEVEWSERVPCYSSQKERSECILWFFSALKQHLILKLAVLAILVWDETSVREKTFLMSKNPCKCSDQTVTELRALLNAQDTHTHVKGRFPLKHFQHCHPWQGSSNTHLGGA